MNINVYVQSSNQEELKALLHNIKETLMLISQELEALGLKVQKIHDAVEAGTVTLKAIAAKILELRLDPAALAEYSAKLDAASDKLSTQIAETDAA